MAANPYNFTGPGERWVEGDPTAEDVGVSGVVEARAV